MKKKLFKLTLFSMMLIGAYLPASAQIYVTVRPPVPVVVRTVQPSPNHVWIREEWNEEGGNYKYSGGHWDAPPHPGYRWSEGHWDHDNHGHHWTHGSWKGGEKRKK